MVEVKCSSQMPESLVLRCRHRDDGERTVVRQRRIELRELVACLPHHSFRGSLPAIASFEGPRKASGPPSTTSRCGRCFTEGPAGEGVHRHRLRGFRHLVYRIVFQQKKKSPGRIRRPAVRKRSNKCETRSGRCFVQPSKTPRDMDRICLILGFPLSEAPNRID